MTAAPLPTPVAAEAPPPARVLGPAALLAAGVAGLGFAGVFPALALALPVGLPLLAVLAVDQLFVARPARGAVLRPVLGLLLGAAALVVVLRVTAGAGPSVVLDGVLTGWWRTLGSTLPAHPDPDLIAFVPALTLLAGVLGTEWGRRGAGPAAVLLPSLAVLALGQLVAAATGRAALVTAAAFGLASVAVALCGRGVGRRAALAPQLVATVVVAVLAAGAAVAAPGRPTFSLQGPTTTHRVVAPDPLDQIAPRLAAGDRPAFSVRTDAGVDRWPLVVLDRFDGVTWSSGARFRTLGSALPAPAVTAPLTPATAEVSGVALDGPWLPSQERLRSADGVRPLVDPATGVLVRGDRSAGPQDYVLRWDDPRVDAKGLTAAAVDPAPVGAVAVDDVPPAVADTARTAVGPDAAPTVAAALVLERWMQQTYQVATGDDLPTGHSTAAVQHFLTTSKRGTSEQFATAYALMADSLGIPVRVVVGFRDDGSGTVHDADVLAWPEIAVSGLGWVPLDPTGGARTSTSRGDDLAAATEAARKALPSADQLAPRRPGEPPPGAAPPAPVRRALPVAWIAVAVLLTVLLALGAVPACKGVRRWARRRAAPRAAVINAWRETRDLLRDHGVPVAAGSTVRDLARVVPHPVAPHDVEALARCVDDVLWAGRPAVDRAPADAAWAAATRIRRALRALPRRRRLRAAFARPRRRAEDARAGALLR